ncbi:MAG: DUF4097 family beta strand repeat-containing protein [Ignavibacteriales bacterium]|nr:DUF4097 family beta strand repeat-containing protein [Ignavibacteriales bacterium]
MKSKKYLLAFAAVLLLTTNMLYAASREDGKTKSFKVSKGGKLNVDLMAGGIIIQTWDKDEILISVEGLSDDTFKKLETEMKGNELFVKFDNDEDDTEDEITFTFTVPAKFNLDLKTMGGDVSLQNNVDGSVTIDTYGGEISSKNIVGSAKVETKGGDINLNEIAGDCDVNTYGGDISIGSINGKNAKVSTNGGDIKIKNSKAGVNAKTYGGDINVGELGGDSDLVTYGGDVTVNFSSGNLNMESSGGNLMLNSAKGIIKAKTSGGDIDFKKVDGSVDLKTMSGSIAIGLNPAANSESKITTNMGSIDLTLSSSANVTVDARIHVQGGWKYSKDDYKIHSDFDSQSYNLDDKARDIVGIYKINGGSSKIYLKSVNDEIKIKKGL